LRKNKKLFEPAGSEGLIAPLIAITALALRRDFPPLPCDNGARIGTIADDLSMVICAAPKKSGPAHQVLVQADR